VPALGALRQGDWKLIVGPERQASWYGVFTPNSTVAPSQRKELDNVWRNCLPACLYNINVDPSEHDDVAEVNPARCAFSDKVLHSRMPLDSTPAPLEALANVRLMCDQWHSSRVSTFLPVHTVNCVQTLKAVVAKMLARFKELESEYHPRMLSPPDLKDAFCLAANAHKGFAAPYCPYTNSSVYCA
jgi:hypothetical protein